MMNHDTTYGMAKFVGQPASKDATLVAYLKSLGALPFARTNVPQGLVGVSCSNPVFGNTINPVNKDRWL